jgi:hypothetical protein
MFYCAICGKQNPDTAKFCTGCGTTLKVKADQPTRVADQRDAEYEKVFGKPQGKKKKTWIIIAVIAILGLGTAAYFIFFNKNTNQAEVNKSDAPDSTRFGSAPQQTMPITADSTRLPAPNPAVSETVPLNPGTTGQEVTISQSEVDAVSQTLRNFYQCDNDEDLSCLLSQYSFPVNRYYQLYNVRYDDLHKLFTESFREKLSYHHITIKWDYCTIQKIGDSYKAVLYADYEFATTLTPDEYRNRSIQIIIFMNSSYHITTIYEN